MPSARTGNRFLPAATAKGSTAMKKLWVLVVALVLVGCGKKEKSYSVQSMMTDLKDTNSGVRYTAAEVLGNYGPEAKDAVPLLIGALKDEDKYVRMRAAYSLAEMGPEAETAIPALKEASRDKEKLVREAAVYAVKQLQSKKK